MELTFIILKEGANMKVAGKMVANMEKELLQEMMVKNMRVNLKIMKSVGTEFKYGQMEKSMMESGKMTKRMDKGL